MSDSRNPECIRCAPTAHVTARRDFRVSPGDPNYPPR